jgi:hypothetical protein
MQFKEILSVPGMGGLYKVVANNKNGFIVESLNDGKRTLVNASQRIMTLVDIAVYTSDGEVPLREVFKKIKEKTGGPLNVDLKGDANALRDFFATVVPEFDQERVYNSDIKKMLTWYSLLQDKMDFNEEEDEGGSELSGPSTDGEKHLPKIHEVHGPKVEAAKKTTARTRKKV